MPDKTETTKNGNIENHTNENTQDKKKGLVKETFIEFCKSLLIGGVPTGLDYLFSALVIFIFLSKALGYSFWNTLFIDKNMVSSNLAAASTAVGYFIGFIAAYLFNVFFVFKHNKKGKTLKGIFIYIGIEVFIYGLNILLAFLLLKILPYTFAFIGRIVISYIFAFLLRKFLVFMPEKKQQNN